MEKNVKSLALKLGINLYQSSETGIDQYEIKLKIITFRIN